MPARTLSLRLRLAGTMALLFLAGTVALYFAAYAYARTAADSSYDRLLSGSAMSIAETLAVSQGSVDVDIPYAALDMLSAAPEDRVFYRVFTSDGRTVTGYPDLPTRIRRSSDRAPERVGPGALRPVPVFFDAAYRGEEVRFVQLGRQIAEAGGQDSVWVQVGQTRLARRALVAQLVVRAIVPIALMTALALAIVWFGIGRALRPLATIGRDLTRRDPSDLSPVSAAVPVEVSPLVEAINGFMARLDASTRGLRAFVGDAAHQMRTPLAALRAQAQLAADDDPAQLRRSVGSIERNAVKLTRLLNQLLSDATVGHRSAERRFEHFDLVDVVREATHEALPQSRREALQVETSLDNAPLVGDPLMLAEAVKNLIDNALTHGGGDIAVSIASDADGYVIAISDRGPGIAAADRDRVFERFERGTATSSGAGLGLPIVLQAVQGHRGTVTLHERAGGGLTVLVRLPKAAK